MPATSREELLDVVRALPFEPSMRLLAALHRDLRFHGVSPGRQLTILHKYVGAGHPLTVAVEEVLRRKPQVVVLSHPQLFALQRLLVLEAGADEVADALSPEAASLLMHALFAVPDTILSEALDDADHPRADSFDPADEMWLRLFVGNGGLVNVDTPQYELARGHRLFGELASSSRARSDPDFCPVDDWLVEAYGLDYNELQAFGIGLWTGFGTFSQEGEFPSLVERTCYAKTLLRDRAERGFDAFVATREWYRAAFLASAESPRRAALYHTPFLARPGLLQCDGKIAVIAPRAVETWLGVKGAYYRLLELSRLRGDATLRRFQRFFGRLMEWYALDVAQHAYPPLPTTLSYAGRVVGEQVYRAGRQEKKTSDIALDLGFDLVLVEVTASRFTERSLVDADAESMRDDIARVITDKLKQLDRVITDLLDGTAELPGVEMNLIQRIWPIVALGDFVWQNPSLHIHVRAGCAGSLQQRRVQPYILLDMEGYERMLGLVEGGGSLARFLVRKIEPPWRDQDFAGWWHGDPARFGTGHNEHIAMLCNQAFDSCLDILGWTRATEAQGPASA